MVQRKNVRLIAFAIGGVIAGAAAVSVPAASEDIEAGLTGLAAAGSQLYEARCSNCHSNEAGKTVFAPTLFGLMGRKAGSVEGFPYTEKITSLNFDWSPETLSGWLQSSSLDSPILRMRHLGVEEPLERDALIAYIATLNTQK